MPSAVCSTEQAYKSYQPSAACWIFYPGFEVVIIVAETGLSGNLPKVRKLLSGISQNHLKLELRSQF